MKFPAFLSLFAFISKIVLCLMRRIRGKEDGLNSFVSGFLAGFSLLVNNDQSTRQMFALYLASRAYDASYNTLDKRGLTPKMANQHLIITAIVSVQWIYVYFAHRDWFHTSYYAILNNFFAIHKAPNDHVMNHIIQSIFTKKNA